MENKERFLSIYREHIHREGSEKLLEYLLSEHSDFFRAPASTRFHGAHTQGLLEHLSLIHICDVIAFPKNANAKCPMSDAPTQVDAAQLEELHIAITEE